MATHGLQFQHDGGKSTSIDILARFSPLTDLVILAETAVQVTPSQEDGPGTMGSDQRLFFPEMGTVAGNPDKGAGCTKTDLVGKAIDSASPWAKDATAQHPPRRINTFLKLTAMEKSGGEGHLGYLLGEKVYRDDKNCSKKLRVFIKI